MLNSHILFAAKSTAYQGVDDMHLFRRQAKHQRTLMLRGIHALIRRINRNLTSYPIRPSNCTFRL